MKEQSDLIEKAIISWVFSMDAPSIVNTYIYKFKANLINKIDYTLSFHEKKLSLEKFNDLIKKHTKLARGWVLSKTPEYKLYIDLLLSLEQIVKEKEMEK
jgi:hypothetical protein